MSKDLYDEVFKKNQNERLEYGNIENSLRYFQTLTVAGSAAVLDVGCNIGSFANGLHAGGWTNVQGIDVADSAVEFGKKTYPAIAGRLRSYSGGRLPYEESSFDVVTAFDLIEHIPDVQSILSEVFRVLKSDGLFVFQTPNKIVNSVWSTIESRSLTKWKEEHCSLQTAGSLREHLRTAGFSSIRIEKFSIVTEYNRAKIRRHLGPVGDVLLHAANSLPLPLFPNLWGNCRKPG